MLEVLDIKDDQGNVIIQHGLKVRHKSSQYEYTIDDVIEDDDGEIVVMLKMPDDPRFDPPPQLDNVISDSANKRIYEVNPSPANYFLPDEESVDLNAPGAEEELLAVPQKEFEKDYEVR